MLRPAALGVLAAVAAATMAAAIAPAAASPGVSTVVPATTGAAQPAFSPVGVPAVDDPAPAASAKEFDDLCAPHAVELPPATNPAL